MAQPTKRALVTGASTGIGLELAKLFAEDGYDALMRGQQKVVAASLMSKSMGVMNKFAPDVIKVRVNRLIATPMGRK